VYLEGEFTMKATSLPSKLILNSNATLTIYSTETVTLNSSCELNQTGSPLDVRIYSSYSSAVKNAITIKSDAFFRAIFYAPLAPVTMHSDVNARGVVYGSSIILDTGVNFYYDEDAAADLSDTIESLTTFTKILWKEVY